MNRSVLALFVLYSIVAEIFEKKEIFMIITIASGKGGTGKTTLATNLAQAACQPVALLDCDVEEPNTHIFLNPDVTSREPVYKQIPQIDAEKCTYCGQCSAFCAYNALATLPSEVLVFSELCHGCGGCMRVCPEGAITEVGHEVGVVECGMAGDITCISGRLHVGEAMAGPVIRAVKQSPSVSQPPKQHDLVIIDAPPGTSCSVVSTLLNSDYCLLVTEPTPFGLHDLSLAVDVARELKIPHGVVINRADCGDGSVEAYCQDEHIPILMQIPNDRKIAEAYSRGQMVVDALPQYREQFCELLARCEQKG
jgi:MinD superfamily P-loop ATPase